MNDPKSNVPARRGEVVHLDNSGLLEADESALRRAVKALEHQNLATRIANTVGRQLGTLGRFIPGPVSAVVNRAAEQAIKTALAFAVNSLSRSTPRDSRLLHKAAAAVSGAAGGMFGMSSLPVELPLSTIIILRSIADIARNEGEDLSDPEVTLACLAVFALGAHDKDDTFMDSGYFAVRSLLAQTISEASRYVTAQGLSGEAAPVLVRLIAQISSRFGIVVSEKLAAQALPVVGAAGGAAVNYAFADHFQTLAFGHFTVRRLERVYGGSKIRAEYDRLVAAERNTAFV
jgi:hypothetical protein